MERLSDELLFDLFNMMNAFHMEVEIQHGRIASEATARRELEAALKANLSDMKPEERLEVVSILQKDFCPHCGSDYNKNGKCRSLCGD